MVDVNFVGPRGREGIGEFPFAGEEQVGAVRTARRLGERHALIGEIEALADREAHPLFAVGRIQEPRSHGKRELIRVSDAVASEVTVLGEQL